MTRGGWQCVVIGEEVYTGARGVGVEGCCSQRQQQWQQQQQQVVDVEAAAGRVVQSTCPHKGGPLSQVACDDEPQCVLFHDHSGQSPAADASLLPLMFAQC